MTNNHLTRADRDELRDALADAQDLLNQAIRHIETYVNATGDSNAEAYLLDHLRIFAGREHGYLSRDLNLDDLIERLDDREPADDDSDDDGYPYSSIDADTPTDANGHYWSESLNRYVTIPADED